MYVCRFTAFIALTGKFFLLAPRAVELQPLARTASRPYLVASIDRQVL
jgi:hypothetical protein